ncbi:MAG: outer membrane protein assembly factor BamD [Rickettsiales bacterium]|nr:outer membrane protein assembly factor BamD [Rickettsiales bacterium]
MFAGCSSSNEEKEEVSAEVSEDLEEDLKEERETVDVLYDRATALFATKDYNGAVEAFEEVERQHPYSDWAKRAQVMAAYSAYRDQDFSSAQAMLERFVKLHPNNPNTPYAYYLRSLTYYDQISDVGRDQKMTEQARQALRDVVSRYPDTDYARDAKLKLDLTEDHLAGKEMHIGRYYQDREEYLAALNRYKYVVHEYETTSHTAEALHRLVEIYLLLGVKEEAKKYAAVLGHNYPGSQWYQFSYAMLNGDVNPESPKIKDEGFWGSLVPTL